MLHSRRRAQTSLEVLFITALILTGVLIIVPPYLHENVVTSAVTYVRNSASDACAYLNTGVVVNESLYEPLNEIIEAVNYTYRAFQISGIETEETEGRIRVKVGISYTGSGMDEGAIESGIREYIEGDLTSRTNVVEKKGKLYLNGYEIEIEVDVVRT
ncbi:hypothetical protein A3L12_03210 [Thermococcus sp. P6]|uniref:hypothetical protein n=1 Tax=Thermococcus sp. P6 TaxID=122420 RepID=UPI000B59A2A6|nr:hypothetical protein [Thermococcus sp. P6]ASJ10377.1 hypothetical protein A3L12_03210 [Thermococcus sp. P6]